MYGGTKGEMQRLIKDASKMKDVQKELGITVDSNSLSFANIVNAISVVQKKMGIANTTAMEAKDTITGSLGAAKAAWQNLLVGVADDNADFQTLIGNFVESFSGAFHNLLPRIETALYGAADLVEELFPVFMEMIPSIIQDFLPKIFDVAQSIFLTLVHGISDNVEPLTATIFSLINAVVETVLISLPEIIQIGTQILVSLIHGISEHPDEVIQTALDIVVTLISGLAEAFPDLIVAAAELIGSLITGIRDSWDDIIDAGKQIIDKIKEGISAAWEGLKSWFNGLWDSLFNRDVNVNVNETHNGSHKGGLSYVPFDGYVAELHKGERVLTAEEARNYNKGGQGVTVVQNIYSKAQTAADLMEQGLYNQRKAVMAGVYG